jgi:O-succinylbenzoic acid--CoA ligase
MVNSLGNLIEEVFHLPQDWLICENSHQFPQLTEKLYLELKQFSGYKVPPKVILAERKPVQFLAGFTAACAANCLVFLCNPDWKKQEWQQVFDLVEPDIIWGQCDIEVSLSQSREQKIQQREIFPCFLPSAYYPSSFVRHTPYIMIPTGGSSGKLKFAIHTWETLTASVRGFIKYFQLSQVNSFCVLPLYHVSGLMQFIRSFSTGGRLAILPFQQVKCNQIYNIDISQFFISLVPTQLQRLLQNPELTKWVSQFKTVVLGGAPAWDELLEKARYYQIPLALTYGMTETAAGITILKPDDLMKGKVSAGEILPHAKVKICNEQGETLSANKIGNITIQAQSLALGYYTSPHPKPDTQNPTPESRQILFKTDDIGFLDEQNYLYLIGRNSEKIITGGEKVYPTEVETAIRATEMVVDICVISIPDKYWGQAVVAIYIPKDSKISASKIENRLKDNLSKYKIPKHWIAMTTLPRNSQGKINHQELQNIAITTLNIANS